MNRELAVLRLIFTWAIEWQFLKAYPMAEVKDLKFQERPPAFPTPDQLDQLLDACRQQCLYAFVILAAHTGMRKSEVFNLRWSDVDFKGYQRMLIEAKHESAQNLGRQCFILFYKGL